MLEPDTVHQVLFQVLLGIGILFRVGTPYSTVPLSITS